MDERPIDTDLKMLQLVAMLRAEMGRWPTDQEVEDFIMGDEKRRLEILNG